MKFQPNHTPWNKGIKTGISWNRGLKTGISPRRGVKLSEETKQKISQAKMGTPSPRKGIKLSKELREKMSKVAMLKNNRGSNHYNWKGGITNFSRYQRTLFKKKMQKLVFERDNYTCQKCGSRGVDLQVDHIKSWSKHKELRFSMDNCRTLCMDCHYKITFNKTMPIETKTWGHNLKVRG